MPYYSFIEPNEIENGHDPVSVKGQDGTTTTIAGGTSQIAQHRQLSLGLDGALSNRARSIKTAAWSC